MPHGTKLLIRDVRCYAASGGKPDMVAQSESLPGTYRGRERRTHAASRVFFVHGHSTDFVARRHWHQPNVPFILLGYPSTIEGEADGQSRNHEYLSCDRLHGWEQTN